jgi:beta-phosphoglucomutase-like phosphatase (HAD superfamily)
VISVVSFNLDGTLVETKELRGLPHAQAVAELRRDTVRDDGVLDAYTDDLVGPPRQEVAKTLMDCFGLEEAAQERISELGEEDPWRVLARVRLDVYETLLQDPDLLLQKRYPHDIEMLTEELWREGYPTACATVSFRHQVEHVLSILGLEDAFDLVATVGDVRSGKHNPEIDLLVAKKMGVPPAELLVIEDSQAGVEAVLVVGMTIVAVSTVTRPPFRDSKVLERGWWWRTLRSCPTWCANGSRPLEEAVGETDDQTHRGSSARSRVATSRPGARSEAVRFFRDER